MSHSKTRQLALCGVLGALMIVIMLLGSIFPFATYLSPAIAGLVLLPAVRECGPGTSTTLYLAVAVLSVLLIPDKEVALLFALLLGPYPLLQPYLNRLSFRPVQLLLKLLVCNCLLILVYALLLFVLAPAALVMEFRAYSAAFLVVLLLLANVVFFLYDLLLRRFGAVYETKLRFRLFHPKRNKK